MRKMKWFRCPYCGNKIILYSTEEGAAKGLYKKCPLCKRNVEIKI